MQDFGLGVTMKALVALQKLNNETQIRNPRHGQNPTAHEPLRIDPASLFNPLSGQVQVLVPGEFQVWASGV